ncbi:MAG: hypothetical protein ACTSRP_20075, partial [Candidatus Helarchaeota archaeon]
KIRYIVNTEPKNIMEEIAALGIDLFSGEKLDDDYVEKIWNSERFNHNKIDIELKKHLKKALDTPNLADLFDKLSQKRLEAIKNERINMIENLKKQNISLDLEGIQDVEVVGIDLLTITLIYPPIGGGK